MPGSCPARGARARGATVLAAGCAVLALAAVAAPATASAAATAARRPASPVAYVANWQSGTVSRFDTATGRRLAAVRLGARSGPIALAVAPNRRTVYVANYVAGTVTPISTRTGRPGRPIKVPALPDYLGITPNGRTLYVASEVNSNDQTPGRVTAISTATNRAGRPIRVGIDPGPIVMARDSRTAYVLTLGFSPELVTPGNVTVIGTATNRVRRLVRITDPTDMALAPGGRTIYVVAENLDAAGCSPPPAQGRRRPVRLGGVPSRGARAAALCGDLIPIATATDRAGRPIPVGDPYLVAAAGGGSVYVLTDAGSITRVAAWTGRVAWTTRPGGDPDTLSVDPAGRTVYALGETSDRKPGAVISITAATGAVRHRTRVGRDPAAIAFGPGGRTAWVVCTPFTETGDSGSFGAGSVIPIRTATGAAGRAIPVGRGPMAIAIVG